jgi:nicotinamide riboside transporter PnuC
MTIWSFVLSGLGVVSLYLTGKKLAVGWLVGLFNTALWVIYALTTAQYGFLVSSAVFTVVQVKNYLEWTKKEPTND